MSTQHATNNALQMMLVCMLGCLLTLTPTATVAATQGNLDAFVASLEGGWTGEDNMTPFGAMPFAVLFEREDDGSLHSRSSLNSETYIDLRFEKDESGRWILSEEAGMEGMGTQGYTLVPTEGPDGMHRWIHEERPGFLTIDLGLEGETMVMAVTLRGKDHLRFALDRLPDEEVAALRQELITAAKTPPGNGNSIRDVVEHFPTAYGEEARSAGADDPIGQARKAVTGSPDDARLRLALAQALGEAINGNPANGPMYAGEMLSSLQKAIELDPKLAEAYHWLVGYYLNAPPIAGGSVVKAEATARRLAEFDAERAAGLLQEIASRQTPRQTPVQ